MAIFIEIRKHLNTITGCIYKISTNDFGGAQFYMEIDNKNQVISFYLSNSFSKPDLVVDCNNKLERINDLPGIDKNIMGRVLMKGLKTMKLCAILPETIDYAA